MPENKEVLKNKQTKTTLAGAYQRDRGASWKSSQQLQQEQSEQQNKVALDYTPKYKRNIHEAILI